MTDAAAARPALLTIRDIHIEGRSDETWTPIIKGVNITLNRGEVLGLIGESGAGKSTLGLAAMGFVRGGCRITGGSIDFDGIDLIKASKDKRRRLRGKRIAYPPISSRPFVTTIEANAIAAKINSVTCGPASEARAPKSPDPSKRSPITVFDTAV